MRMKTLFALAALCCFGLACSSSTDEGMRDIRLLDYALVEVGGESVPGPLSSLPGLWLWEGNDGTVVTVAKGGVACDDDGTAEESYLFRRAEPGSAIWDPIWVNIDLTCETVSPGSIRFRNPDTGEVTFGSITEDLQGCVTLSKAFPSVEALKIGYLSADSEASFPSGMGISGSPAGIYLESRCYGF